VDTINLAIIGATGAVGEVVVELLGKSTIPVDNLHLLASERTAGTSLMFRNKAVMVEVLGDFDFSSVDIAIFVATDGVSAEYAPKAQAAGCLVVDNSRAFVGDDSAVLLIPDVNGDILSDSDHSEKPSLFVNPDSSVISLWSVLKPIYDEVGIYRANVTVLDSVSRHGKKAIHELATQTASLLNAQGAEPKFFDQQIAFNVLPSVGDIDEDGYTAGEQHLFNQSRTIINDNQLQLNVTCVQVPVFYADSMTVSIETGDPVTAAEVSSLLEKTNGISILSGSSAEEMVTPVTTAAGKDNIFVSRIRNDLSHNRGINLWLVSDNVRKGAALNTIQIVEQLKKSYL